MNLAETMEYFSHPADLDQGRRFRALAQGRALAVERAIVAGAPVAAAPLTVEAARQTPWRPEFGRARSLIGEGRLTAAAAQFSLGAVGLGAAGRHCGRLEGEAPLFFEGYTVPAAGDWSLDATEGAVTIRSEAGRVSFARGEDGWALTDHDRDVWPVRRTGHLGARYIISTRFLPPGGDFQWPLQDEGADVDADMAELSAHDAAVVRGAWEVLLAGSERYTLWVARSASGILFHRPIRPNVNQSGTSSAFPGLLQVSRHEDPTILGEILVHECSHQYLSLLRDFGPLADEAAGETSFSPIKKMDRPIDKVLVGAHAVGNMILYYRDLHARGMGGHVRDRYDVLVGWFEDDYRPALDGAKTLTEGAAALWRNLAAAVTPERVH